MKTHGSRGWRSRLIGGVVIAAGVLTMTQCKKSPTAPVLVVSSNTSVATTKATLPALDGQTFTFSNAAALAPQLANQSFTLAFTNTSAATPTATFVVAGASGGTMVGNTTFGSCIFTITSASGGLFALFPAGTKLTFEPCTINVNSAGQSAGTTLPAGVGFTLGGVISGQVLIPVTISSTGTITIGGVTIGTAPLTPATGTGG